MSILLPYGRRLAWYWTGDGWRARATRLAGTYLVRVGPLFVVLYTHRVDWSDLDAKIECEYQRKRGQR